MAILGEITGAILVEDISEAKHFYKETFGLTDVSYHGMDMLALNGKLFFYMWKYLLNKRKHTGNLCFLRVTN